MAGFGRAAISFFMLLFFERPRRDMGATRPSFSAVWLKMRILQASMGLSGHWLHHLVDLRPWPGSPKLGCDFPHMQRLDLTFTAPLGLLGQRAHHLASPRLWERQTKGGCQLQGRRLELIQVQKEATWPAKAKLGWLIWHSQRLRLRSTAPFNLLGHQEHQRAPSMPCPGKPNTALRLREHSQRRLGTACADSMFEESSFCLFAGLLALSSSLL